LFYKDSDEVLVKHHVSTSVEDKAAVEFATSADKQAQGKSSYRYFLRLEPELVIRALMKLTETEIVKAIHGNTDADAMSDEDAKIVADKIGSLAKGIAMKDDPHPGLFG